LAQLLFSFLTDSVPKEAAMKMLLTLPFVLAVAAAGAQTTSQNQVRHVETSLNHLTVIEFGEPVTTALLH
jgi:hypothetical protein